MLTACVVGQENTQRGAGTVGQPANPAPGVPAFRMGTSSSPHCSSFDPAPCLWCGKAADNGSSHWVALPV